MKGLVSSWTIIMPSRSLSSYYVTLGLRSSAVYISTRSPSAGTAEEL